MKRLALLDRDGTLIVHKPYLCDPEQVELLPGTAEGLRQLRLAGLKLAVVSNQSGVARGYFGAEAVEAVHQRIRDLLVPQGVEIDSFYWCCHLPEAGCNCRKPKPGLALQACRELGVEPDECLVVGDSDCDIALGQGLGAPTFRLISPLNLGVADNTLKADHDILVLQDVLPLLGTDAAPYDGPRC